VRVIVDPTKCQGHNRCVVAAPGLFEIDDLGYSHEIGRGDVPPDREESARLAVANCPERAISLVEEKANVR
jgi:ferredoxin